VCLGGGGAEVRASRRMRRSMSRGEWWSKTSMRRRCMWRLGAARACRSGARAASALVYSWHSSCGGKSKPVLLASSGAQVPCSHAHTHTHAHKRMRAELAGMRAWGPCARARTQAVWRGDGRRLRLRACVAPPLPRRAPRGHAVPPPRVGGAPHAGEACSGGALLAPLPCRLGARGTEKARRRNGIGREGQGGGAREGEGALTAAADGCRPWLWAVAAGPAMPAGARRRDERQHAGRGG